MITFKSNLGLLDGDLGRPSKYFINYSISWMYHPVGKLYGGLKRGCE